MPTTDSIFCSSFSLSISRARFLTVGTICMCTAGAISSAVDTVITCAMPTTDVAFVTSPTSLLPTLWAVVSLTWIATPHGHEILNVTMSIILQGAILIAGGAVQRILGPNFGGRGANLFEQKSKNENDPEQKQHKFC